MDSDEEELYAIAAAQRRELTVAEASDADLEFAYNLQLQEALTASLSLLPSTSSSSVQHSTSSSNAPEKHISVAPSQSASTSQEATSSVDVTSFASLQAEYLDVFSLERKDRQLAENEMLKAKEELLRKAHDRHVATQIVQISEDEWEDTGDYFEVPFSEQKVDTDFKIYCKGFISEENEKGVVFAGIGVAICDWADNLVFEMRKPVLGLGKSRQAVEMKAVIEGLTAAIALDLKRVVFYFDYYALYQLVVGRWLPKQRKITVLLDQLNQLRGYFISSAPSLVARNDLKFALKLAREAIVSQINRPAESSCVKNMNEMCAICLEEKDVGQFFLVDECSHRYCFSCMKQHVEVKLLHGMLAKCPHEGCNSELKIESCRKFLTPKLIDMMSDRLKEASIPVTEKLYCPYPKCSFLMTKKEVLEYSRKASVPLLGAGKCLKCEELFCILCKAPWHHNMSCSQYKRRNPDGAEDMKLKTLAYRNLWRQCIKCKHMIELESGCYHMTCRCGYEFCYTCGAEWKNKKATCSCPLWDVHNILDDDDEDSDEDDDYDYETDSDDYY